MVMTEIVVIALLSSRVTRLKACLVLVQSLSYIYHVSRGQLVLPSLSRSQYVYRSMMHGHSDSVRKTVETPSILLPGVDRRGQENLPTARELKLDSPVLHQQLFLPLQDFH